MRAATGDRIIVRGHSVGEHQRSGLILAVEAENGGPPYVVCWDETGHESVFFPESDSVVEHHSTAGSGTQQGTRAERSPAGGHSCAIGR